MKRQPLAIFSLAALAFCIAALPIALAAKNTPASAPPQDVAVAPALNDGTASALAAIAGRGMMDSHAYEYLEQLSDDVGPRLTGSERCNQAVQWGLDTMRAIGLQNVHAEPWQIFRGWQRISASAEVVSPSRHPLMIDSMGWVGSTPRGGVTAELVPVNVFDLDNELAHNSSNWRGKILIAIQKGPRPEGEGMEEFAKFGDVLKKAHEAGAVAVIGGQGGAKSQGMHLTHTGALGFDTFYDIPVVSISAENQVTDGPANTANAVGEIPGTEHPEQIIVVGGHLDSWDLSEGSTDDGVGVVTTLGAAEAILRSGFKPRRTIRLVLF